MKKEIFTLIVVLSMAVVSQVNANGWLGGDPTANWSAEHGVTVRGVWSGTDGMVYFDITTDTAKVFIIDGNQKNLISILLTAVNSGKNIRFYYATPGDSYFARTVYNVAVLSIVNSAPY